MKNQLVVVFGLPGAGKSYVADILGKDFGFYIYDGDSDIPGDMRDALNHKDIITDTMRADFLNLMIASVKTIGQKHNNIVIHQTFLKGFMRKKFLAAFPFAKLILVQSPDALREKRYMKRIYFNLGLAYLRLMSNLFDPVDLPHEVIINDLDGIQNIQKQLRNIITPR